VCASEFCQQIYSRHQQRNQFSLNRCITPVPAASFQPTLAAISSSKIFADFERFNLASFFATKSVDSKESVAGEIEAHELLQTPFFANHYGFEVVSSESAHLLFFCT
jgi:hypothetical protein